MLLSTKRDRQLCHRVLARTVGQQGRTLGAVKTSEEALALIRVHLLDPGWMEARLRRLSSRMASAERAWS